ncbi:hypothetical protein L1278_001999 [Pontibacter sp. HSC-36F09]|nr:hypothetical protein [Pontibacter sp. HSC-36F09]
MAEFWESSFKDKKTMWGVNLQIPPLQPSSYLERTGFIKS